MPWMPNIPHDPGEYPLGSLSPTAVVLHRTIGSWPGDYGVGKHGRDGEPIGFHFLIGRDYLQIVQFYSTETKCAHAAGANSWSVGIEFSGQNSDVQPLSDWQIAAGGDVLRWITATHGIPLTYYDGPRVTSWSGVLNHRNVAYPADRKFEHHDFVTAEDYGRMVAAKPSGSPIPPPPIPFEEDDVAQIIDHGRGLTLYDGGHFLDFHSEEQFREWAASSKAPSPRVVKLPHAYFLAWRKAVLRRKT